MTDLRPAASPFDPSREAELEGLMSRHAAGDESAFTELHHRLAPVLLRYLVRLSGDRELAQDVLQTTFSKLHRWRDRYQPGAPVIPWARVIARRTYFDEKRGLAARYEVLAAEGTAHEPTAPSANLDHVADVRWALERLPDKYRSAIQLTKLLGFSGEEAARLLCTTQAAIKVRVHRGVALLKSGLAVAPSPA